MVLTKIPHLHHVKWGIYIDFVNQTALFMLAQFANYPKIPDV